ncbi:MAG: response regulator [Oscillospiraceae bacterium]|jgi:two-component system response regulator YesN|nr:response regulator [Oscillospiraceae bacterium]
MYRLLIVDDEEGHRSGLIGLLRALKPDYLVFEAEHGAAALQMMDVMDFDLVLTDIRMPRVDGLAFLERAKERSPNTRVAILSAYGLFDYAKQSVSLGADDYLLKPVDPQELRRCLDRMENRVEKDRSLARNPEYVGARLYQFVTGELPAKESGGIRALFGECDSGVALHIQPIHPWSGDERREAFQIGMRARMKRFGPAMVFQSPVDPGAMVGVAACPPGMLDQLMGAVADGADGGVLIGVCRMTESFFERLDDAYARAKTACVRHFYEPEQTIFSCEDAALPDPFASARFDISIKELDSHISQGDAAKAYALFERGLNRPGEPMMYPSKVKEVVMYTFMFLLGNLTYPLSRQVKDELLVAINRTALECASMGGMLEEVRGAFYRVAEAVEADRLRRPARAFSEITKYLSERLDTELPLADVARRFHYHPTYFSELFKRSVGKGFSEYLFDLRMKEAARLLLRTTMYAAKVGERVGYPNAAYFTKAFKKQFGISPDQYRKRGQG